MKRRIVWVVIAIVFFTILFLAVALPSYVPRRVVSARNACINNLRTIDGAKEQWALEKKVEKGVEVRAIDLTGTNGYLTVFPKCPKAGAYTVGAVGEDPKCTVKGHTISFEGR